MDIHLLGSQIIIFLQVILIDIVMSSDNALVISMTTQNLPHHDKSKAIIGGAIGGAALRIIFALFLIQFLQMPIFKIIGGLLLLYICAKLYRQIRDHHPKSSKHHRQWSSFRHAIRLITIADISMSLDNVLAISATIEHSVWLLVIGIAVSVALMVVAASRLQHMIARYPVIQWVGFAVILFVALKLVIWGAAILIPVQYYDILMSIGFVWLMLIVMILHHLYLAPFEKHQLNKIIVRHAPAMIMILLLMIVWIIGYNNVVMNIIHSHPHIAQGSVIIIFLLLIELISIQKISSLDD
jgi:YjbE family integral membrane protein